MDKFIKFCINHNRDYDETTKNIGRIKKICNVEEFEDVVIPLLNFTEVLEKLMDTFSLNTCIAIMDTIKMIGIFYNLDQSFMINFLEEQRNLEDLKENKSMYSKFSIFEIQKIMEEKAEYYLNNHCPFTFLRNFVVVYLFLNEMPLRLSQWTNIKLVIADYEILEDFDEEPFYLVAQQGNFYFIINKFKDGYFTGQYIQKVKKRSNKLLTKYIFNMGAKGDYLVCNKSKKAITNTNLANAIDSFTKKLFGKRISINNLRSQLKAYQDVFNLNSQQKKVFLI
tara:strand:+ start:2031 stop:2873 length:843 start_codon:yes stop_codon:yes gene_type:complete